MAFRAAYMDDLSCLLQHGAQLDSFGTQPVRCLNSHASQQMKLLRSAGFSDWKPLRHMLLHATVQVHDTADTLFVLECVKIEPNRLLATMYKTLSDNDVYNSSILMEYGAVIDYSTTAEYTHPWTWNLNTPHIEVPHWLLFHCADLKRRNSYLRHEWRDFLWDNVWLALLRRDGDALPFIQMESVLSHYLLHGSDPHKIISIEGNILALIHRLKLRSFEYPGHRRAMEIARVWAPSLFGGDEEVGSQERVERPRASELHVSYEEKEIQRSPWLASWSISDGTVFYTRRAADPNRSDRLSSPLPPLLKKTKDAFQRTSLFYETIATPEGRSHLSRFPYGKKISLIILFPS